MLSRSWASDSYPSDQGNTGSASVFLAIEAMAERGMAKKGQKLLVFVPESARFNVSFGLFTVA